MVGVLSLLFQLTDISSLVENLRLSSFWIVLIVQPIVLITTLILAYRHAILVSTPPSPIIPTFKAILLSHGMNMVIPFRMSELLKSTYLNEHCGIPFPASISAIIISRMTDMVLFVFFAILSVGLLVETERLFSLVFILGVVVLVFYMLYKHDETLERCASLIPVMLVRKIFIDFIRNLSEQTRSKAFWISFFLGLVAWGLMLVSTLLVIRYSGSINVGFTGALEVYVLSLLGYVVSILPEGFGTFEAGAIFAMQRYGYTIEEAFGIAIALHVSQLLICFIGAALILLFENVGIRSMLKKIKKVKLAYYE